MQVVNAYIKNTYIWYKINELIKNIFSIDKKKPAGI